MWIFSVLNHIYNNNIKENFAEKYIFHTWWDLKYCYQGGQILKHTQSNLASPIIDEITRI